MRKLYFVVCISLLTPAGAIIIPAFPVSVSDNLLSAAKLTISSRNCIAPTAAST
jgi:hypothetical protein